MCPAFLLSPADPTAASHYHTNFSTPLNMGYLMMRLRWVEHQQALFSRKEDNGLSDSSSDASENRNTASNNAAAGTTNNGVDGRYRAQQEARERSEEWSPVLMVVDGRYEVGNGRQSNAEKRRQLASINTNRRSAKPPKRPLMWRGEYDENDQLIGDGITQDQIEEYERAEFEFDVSTLDRMNSAELWA